VLRNLLPLELIRRLPGISRPPSALIGGFRRTVDATNEKSDHVLHLTLVLYVILGPRFRAVSDAHPHHEPFLEFKDVFVRIVVADEEET
jgi:hypothetical protein